MKKMMIVFGLFVYILAGLNKVEAQNVWMGANPYYAPQVVYVAPQGPMYYPPAYYQQPYMMQGQVYVQPNVVFRGGYYNNGYYHHGGYYGGGMGHCGGWRR